MADKIERVLTELRSLELGEGQGSPLSPVCVLAMAAVFLGTMLSVPQSAPAMLLWYAVVLVVLAPLLGQDYNRVLLRSLAVLPLAVMIGVFDPIYHREVAFRVGGVAVSRGWVEFFSLTVRSVLAVQMLLILIGQGGFTGLCRSLERLHVPALITMQLLMVYRYITVLVSEAVDMTRARRARGYGRRHLGLKMWGVFCGQLLLRTVARSERVHRAMLARGFDGRMPLYGEARRWSWRDTLSLGVFAGVCAALRIFHLAALFYLL